MAKLHVQLFLLCCFSSIICWITGYQYPRMFSWFREKRAHYASTEGNTADIPYFSLTDFNTTFRSFPGIEQIVLRSPQHAKVPTYLPHPQLISPETTEKITPKQSQSHNRRPKDPLYTPNNEDRRFWQIWKHRKELEASLIRLLFEQNRDISAAVNNLDYQNDKPLHRFDNRTDGDSLLQREISKIFDQLKQFNAIEKSEILQLISGFYRNLFGEMNPNPLVNNNLNGNKRNDVSFFWCQTNSTVFRPIGEHNIYNGFDNIRNYYHKHVPLTTIKAPPIITDLFVHFYGNAAIVTNEFVLHSADKFTSTKSDKNQPKIDIDDYKSRRKAKKIPVPFYATTILIKSQNDGRYYIHSHVVEGYENLKKDYFDNLRTSYWEPAITAGRRIPLGDPYAPLFRMDKDNNAIGLSSIVDEENAEDDDEDEEDVDSEVADNSFRFNGANNPKSVASNEMMQAIQDALMRRAMKAEGGSNNPLSEDMKNSISNKLREQFRHYLRSRLESDPDFQRKLQESQLTIAKELASMRPETREKSLSAIKRELGEGEVQKIIQLMQNFDTEGNLITPRNKDDDSDSSEYLTLQSKDDDDTIVISDEDDVDDNDDELEDEDIEDDEDDDEEEEEEEILDSLASLTTNVVLYLHEKGRLSAEEKKVLISYNIDSVNQDQYSKLDVAFSVIIAGVRPDLFEKKAKELISTLKSSLAISNNAFSKIADDDMDEFEMICHKTFKQLKDIERLERIMEQKIKDLDSSNGEGEKNADDIDDINELEEEYEDDDDEGIINVLEGDESANTNNNDKKNGGKGKRRGRGRGPRL